MSKRRRSNEAGHKRKYLVVIDDTDECDRAVYWAACRAARTHSQIVMLRVIEDVERNQQWLGVADIMKAEQEDAAKAVLKKYAQRIHDVARLEPERVIREGVPADEMLKVIEQDDDIGILVLAADSSKEGPGPLVTSVAKSAGTFPITVAIVPGHLSDEELEAMS